MPTAAHAVPDPASRVRRLIASARENGGTGRGDLGPLERSLARLDAPEDIRVRGGVGTGRRTLAAALRDRRGWRVTVDDLDEIAAPGAPVGPPPDIEIVCLRTAPCRHEEAWIRRRHPHSLMVVATGLDGAPRPGWATDLHAVDARDPADGSLDAVVGFVERALDGMRAVRLARLAADLDALSVVAGIDDLAETALCALDRGAVP